MKRIARKEIARQNEERENRVLNTEELSIGIVQLCSSSKVYLVADPPAPLLRERSRLNLCYFERGKWQKGLTFG